MVPVVRAVRKGHRAQRREPREACREGALSQQAGGRVSLFSCLGVGSSMPLHFY